MTPLETGGPAYLAGYAGGTLVVVWVVYRIGRRLLGDVLAGFGDD